MGFLNDGVGVLLFAFPFPSLRKQPGGEPSKSRSPGYLVRTGLGGEPPSPEAATKLPGVMVQTWTARF